MENKIMFFECADCGARSYGESSPSSSIIYVGEDKMGNAHFMNPDCFCGELSPQDLIDKIVPVLG